YAVAGCEFDIVIICHFYYYLFFLLCASKKLFLPSLPLYFWKLSQNKITEEGKKKQPNIVAKWLLQTVLIVP
ncbi:MAG: hypothetical protein KAJ40_03175, partial [Alphaproteobacteria bacterium]|nr:hypothetical protein [Alphaproteobacteria bacterium]